MTKREQYGLTFYNPSTEIGNRIPFIKQTRKLGNNSVLTFIHGLCEEELTSFIDDLNSCLEGKGNVDEGFFSDGVEHMGTILYKYPNVVINDLVTITIPMEDMLGLLQEWVEFIS